METEEHSGGPLESGRVVRCAHTVQVITGEGLWSRIVDGALCRYLRWIAGIAVGLYGLSIVLLRYGDAYQSGALFAKTVALLIAGLWLGSFLVNEVIGSIRFRSLEREHCPASGNAKVWIGKSLGPAELLEEMRKAPFPTLVTEYALWTRFSAFLILGVALFLASSAVIAAMLLGVNPRGCAGGTIGLFICVVVIEPYVFPNRIKIGPGRLQTIKGSSISKSVSVEHDVGLGNAAVTVLSLSPTRVVIRWNDGTGQKELRLNNLPKEVCFYVWLASVSDVVPSDFPNPVLGEALVGITRRRVE